MAEATAEQAQLLMAVATPFSVRMCHCISTKLIHGQYDELTKEVDTNMDFL
jgi:hypothetical protein